MSLATLARRTGDQIAIPGDYQHRAYHHGWAAQRFWHHAKLVEAERWLAPAADDVILDVGCGSGLLAARLAAHTATHVIGVDGNAAAIEFARRQFQRSNLEFRLGLVDELDLPDASVDKIAFLEVIEHIQPEQAQAVLRTFHRVLKPGGRVVISTPNAASLWPLIEWTLDRFGLVAQMAGDQHVALYDSTHLARTAERAALQLLACRTINAVAPWLAGLSWRLAETMHRLEQARPQPFGSILLMTFAKSC